MGSTTAHEQSQWVKAKSHPSQLAKREHAGASRGKRGEIYVSPGMGHRIQPCPCGKDVVLPIQAGLSCLQAFQLQGPRALKSPWCLCCNLLFLPGLFLWFLPAIAAAPIAAESPAGGLNHSPIASPPCRAPGDNKQPE